ncbi:MAG: phage terminase large subunit family protein [Gemmataceae bacterium]|nr:phage terminase large subunit family protein [Gemmataceae bacterium]
MARSSKPKTAKKKASSNRPIEPATDPHELPVPSLKLPPIDERYEEIKLRAAERSKKLSAQGRDIGPLPAIENPARRKSCESKLALFNTTYFPDLYPLDWSDDHLDAMKRIEECVRSGGLFAFAMPRGSGKTTLCETAAIWSLCYGYRRFALLLGANKEKAVEILDRIKTQFETNELLAADFPEICYPIARLERIYNRANGQLLDGKPTRIGWTRAQIILPTVAGSAASGSILRVAGILGGGIRGAKHQAGKIAVRPDLAISDDPQTASSAKSKTQNDAREKVMKRDVVGVAGPGQTIAAFMPCTVIVRGDMADRMLDRKLNPDWRGVRRKLLYEWPSDMKLWQEYARIRAESLEAGGDGSPATAFYRANRKAMDAGARVGWKARKLPEEMSALQHAMNLHFKDPDGFLAEFQNEPRDESAGAANERLTAAILEGKLMGQLPRRILPRDCARVTAFIDVQKLLLFYLVVGWDARFGGAIIDYGTWPEQTLPNFRADTASPTLAERYPNTKGITGPIYAGLVELVRALATRRWLRDGIGDEMPISRILIDANWGQSTKTVYQFCRDSDFRGILTPSHGRGIGASGRPFSQYKPNGLKAGVDWRHESGTNGLHVSYDTNAWKSFVSERLATPLGSHGALGVFAGETGVKLSPRPAAARHRLLFEHLSSEFAVTTKGPWREVDEWKLQPGRENHWWDCLVGAAVAASIDGLKWSPAAAAGQSERPPAKPLTQADIDREIRSRKTIVPRAGARD